MQESKWPENGNVDDFAARAGTGRTDGLKETERAMMEATDLASMLQLPEGFRVMLRLLQSCGAARECAPDPGEVALRNFAEMLLDSCATAHFPSYVRLMASLRAEMPSRLNALKNK